MDEAYENNQTEDQSSNNNSEDQAILSWDHLDVFAQLPSSSILSRMKYSKIVRRKQILCDVSGEANKGSMLAIMGSSGSGKTTLINILAGFQSRKLKISGKILVNGKNIDLRSVSSYVEQNDLFIQTLTVSEHLFFNARLMLNQNMSKKNIQSVVDNIIQTFGLEKCKNSQIGGPTTRVGISGGEKRRLSIATKVISNPKIIFLDEPTSGLDSYMVENIITTLKNMSLKCIVIATIHQPSSQVFEMFENLYLLSEGSVVFSGKREEALGFFSRAGMVCPTNFNPADFYIERIAIKLGYEEECKTRIDILKNENLKIRKLLQDSQDTSTEEKTEIKMIASRKAARIWHQFFPLLWRSWISNIREPLLFKSRIISTIFISLMYGLIFLNQPNDTDSIPNFAGAMFGLLAQCTFGSVLGVTFLFPNELAVFRREHSTKLYDTSVYFIAKTLVDIPVFVLVPTIQTLIVYWMIGFNPALTAVFIHWGIVLLVSHVAVSYGYIISVLARDFQMASSLSTPLLIPLLIFGGLFIRSVNIPIYFQWLSYISWFKYGFDALCTNHFTGRNIECRNTTRNCAGNFTSVDGKVALDLLGLEQHGIPIDVGSLIALMIGFRIVALCFLTLKTYIYER